MAREVSDKLQFVAGSRYSALAGSNDELIVAGSPHSPLAGSNDKLKFVGHSLRS